MSGRESDGGIRHVADTAFLIAQCRAVESARPDALFRDPLAARLAGDKGKAILAAFPTAAMTQWMTAMRTVIIDDYVREAVARGVDTVVNLGAGLDTRPYRMELPATVRWIEVDYPEVIRYKEGRLEDAVANCVLERVHADLADDAARRQLLQHLLGNAAPRRTLVLTEGVVIYLSEDQVASLAADVNGMRAVESWIVDYLSPRSHQWRDKRHSRSGTMKNAPIIFRPADWFAFFRGVGWDVADMRYLMEAGTRLGRPFPMPRLARLIVRLILAMSPAAQRDDSMKMVGYARLTHAAH